MIWLITNEEIAIASRFIYLPMVRIVLEGDMKRIKMPGLKFSEPYLVLVERALTKVGMDIGALKVEMGKRGIKVVDMGKVDQMCHYVVYSRGYEREIHLFPHLMKNNVQKYVMTYVNK